MGAGSDTGVAALAFAPGFGVVAGEAGQVAALKEDGHAASGTVHEAGRKDAMDAPGGGWIPVQTDLRQGFGPSG